MVILSVLVFYLMKFFIPDPKVTVIVVLVLEVILVVIVLP
jgi:hypothetical protein